eukprot:14013665-Ditylum_brightwellii.AAC.1
MDIRLSVAYDTCAVFCVGWADYHLAIAKKFPHIVKSLTWAKDAYTPITLSGIVSPDDTEATKAILTTTLPAVIEYYLPMKTKSSNQASIKIAIGEKVAVNTIIGICVIKAAKWSLDLEDKVIDPGIFKTEPFK